MDGKECIDFTEVLNSVDKLIYFTELLNYQRKELNLWEAFSHFYRNSLLGIHKEFRFYRIRIFQFILLARTLDPYLTFLKMEITIIPFSMWLT